MAENKHEKISIIHAAAMNKDDDISEIRKITLRSPVSIEHTDSKGRTPLMTAVICGNIKITNHLLRSRADKNKTDINGWTALHHAVKNYRTSITKMLVKDGIYIAGEGEENCLHIAVETGNFELVAFFLDHGADSAACNQYGCTSLVVACNKGYQNIALKLIKHCSSDNSMIHKVNNNGYSALHFAVEKKLAGAVDKLLKKGADINLRNQDGATPLFLATEKGHTYIVGVLVSQNADANISLDKCKNTPCHIAAKNGQFEIIHCLVTQGKADINLQNHDGNTPLHLAYIHQQEAIVKFIFIHKPKMLPNHSGYKPNELPNTKLSDVSEKEIKKYQSYSVRKKETCTLIRLDGSIRESKRKMQEIAQCFQKYNEAIKSKESSLIQRSKSCNEELEPSQQKKLLSEQVSFPYVEVKEETDANEFESVDTYVKQQQIEFPRYQEELRSLEDDVTRVKSHSQNTNDETSVSVADSIQLHMKELDKKMNNLYIKLDNLCSVLSSCLARDESGCSTSCQGSITDNALCKAAAMLGKGWQDLGIELKFDTYELERLEIDNKGDVLAAIRTMLIRIYMGGGVCESKARLDNRVVIVTGANTGIGKVTVLDLVKRGAKVYMACRSLQRCNNAADDIRKATNTGMSNVIVMKLDLASIKSIREFVKLFSERESKLNILINNAGIGYYPNHTKTEDGFELTFGVNHLGHFLLTNLLMTKLVAGKPSRVVTVSSKAHDYAYINWDDLQTEKDYSMFHVYGQSKLANILFSKELGKRLKGHGITTYSLHPGIILTEIARYMPFMNYKLIEKLAYFISQLFFKSLEQGAQTTLCCAIDEKLALETGQYYIDCAPATTYGYVDDIDEESKRLWEVSVELVHLKPEEIHPLLK